MKATAVPAVEHTASSPAVHTGKQGNTAFFGPAAGNEAPFFAPRIQTKLTIGRPGDKYEQEADAVADRVVQRLANPGPPVAVQKKCQDCEEKEKLQRKEEEEEREAPEVMRKEAEEEEEAPPVQAKEKEEEEKPGLMRQAGPEEEESLQAKAAPEGAAAPSPSLESRLSSAKGAGAPMDKSTRQPMEAAFGQDFSRVRIHTDSSSAQMNRELNARAFTHGRDIYFNAGEYSPGSTEGRRLLAHELVHVGQRGGDRNIFQKQTNNNSNINNSPCPISSSQIVAPNNQIIYKKLCLKGILGDGKSRLMEFHNLLRRHIEANTNIGKQYLSYLSRRAYPMANFNIVNQGRSPWEFVFKQVLPHYNVKYPVNRGMRFVYGNVLKFAVKNLVACDKNGNYIKQWIKGVQIIGAAPESMLLLKATDEFISSLSLTAAQVNAIQPKPLLCGIPKNNCPVFKWKSLQEEGTIEDPNKYDALIFYWVSYYNQIFRPVDNKGSSNPLDPDLVKAIIYEESRFSHTEINRKSGAFGLMQVLPSAVPIIKGWEAGITKITKRAQQNPQQQIALGIRVLFEKYKRKLDWKEAVKYYFGGTGRVAYLQKVWKTYLRHKRKL